MSVALTDANDNAPLFESDQYILQVPEDIEPDTSIFTLAVREILVVIIYVFFFAFRY